VCTDEVIARWSGTLRHELPWRDMPLDDVSGEMRRVVIELVNAACEFDRESRRRRIAAAARAHGSYRQAQRCPRGALSLEFALVRGAITGGMRGSGWPDAQIRQAVDNLVPDIRLARHVAERWFEGSRTPEAVQ